LDFEIGVDITIEGWDKDEVDFNANLTGDDVDDIEVNFEESDEGIIVTAENAGYSGDNDTGGKVTVRVPQKFDVKFITMGGDIKITSVEGKLSGKTMGGDIYLRDLKGELQLTTMGGDIELKDSDADGKVNTMGGDIDVVNVTGSIDAKTMGGDIKQTNVKRRSGSVKEEGVHIETMGGDIDVDEAPFGAKVKTMGGDISINKVEMFVDATTMGGDIEIKSVDGRLEAVTMGGDIIAKVVGDPQSNDKEIRIKSNGGDVKIYLPDNFSMDLDLDIAFDRRHEDRAEIVSDFKCDIEKSDRASNDHGKKNRHIYGTGSLNGGKNKVTIKTINGKIYLLKS
jgi:hypothetical protein